jgi:hypothetical protein
MTSVSALPAMPQVGAIRRKRGETDSSDTSGDDESEIDSMRPVVPTPRRKRRRKLTDAMKSMNLHRESEGEDDDADSSQAVADDDEEADAYTASSLDDYDDFSHLEEDEDDEQTNEQTNEPTSDSDRQAQRKVMFELVFGPERPSSVVEARLEELIRNSLHQASLASAKTQDDMSMDACFYCRPSAPLSHEPLRTRSNSLPNTMSPDEPSDEMDIDD